MPGGYVEALVDLLLPRLCVGCDRPGASLCAACLGAIGPVRVHAPDPTPPGFPRCWSAGEYDGTLRSAILALKERQRRELAGQLGGILLGPVVHAIAQSQHDTARAWPVPLLVPVPSTSRAAADRGGDHLRRISRSLSAVRGTRPAGRLALLVSASGRSADATELNADQRKVARSSAFALRPGSGVLAHGRDVILLDDIVTTGWTLAACAELCRRAGARQVYAATIAATARKIT